MGELTGIDAGAWQAELALNLTSVFYGLKHQIPAMLAQGRGGAIVNTASVSGLKGFPPLLPAYVASKFGVVGLTAATARQTRLLRQ